MSVFSFVKKHIETSRYNRCIDEIIEIARRQGLNLRLNSFFKQKPFSEDDEWKNKNGMYLTIKEISGLKKQKKAYNLEFFLQDFEELYVDVSSISGNENDRLHLSNIFPHIYRECYDIPEGFIKYPIGDIDSFTYERRHKDYQDSLEKIKHEIKENPVEFFHHRFYRSSNLMTEHALTIGDIDLIAYERRIARPSHIASVYAKVMVEGRNTS
jgi:hypothetical protein